MARDICVKPCPPTENLPSLKIPMIPGAMKAQANFSLQGGCDGCEFVGSLMLQLNPLLAGLGLPLCFLGCLASLIEFVQSVPHSLGPPPDPSKILQAVNAVVAKCKCVVQLGLPPPIGPICDFLKFVRDIIVLVDLVVDCIIGLIIHLLTLDLKASVLLADPNGSVQAVGNCLAGQVQALMDTLNGKFGAVSNIIQILQPLFDILSAVTPPPFSEKIEELKNGFLSFSGSVPIGTPPGEFRDALLKLKKTVDDVTQAVNTVVAICP